MISSAMPQATFDFDLTSLSGNTATGRVTAQSDPQDSVTTVGDPVTATIKPGLQGKGQVLHLKAGSTMDRMFCNNTSLGQCGA